LLRLGVRLRRGAPPLPADLPWWQTAGAKASHVLLYTLLNRDAAGGLVDALGRRLGIAERLAAVIPDGRTRQAAPRIDAGDVDRPTGHRSTLSLAHALRLAV
jgi:hypothetical protein